MSREGVAPSPTHWCSSYQKGSLRVTLDYGRQLYYLCYITPGRVDLRWMAMNGYFIISKLQNLLDPQFIARKRLFDMFSL